MLLIDPFARRLPAICTPGVRVVHARYGGDMPKPGFIGFSPLSRLPARSGPSVLLIPIQFHETSFLPFIHPPRYRYGGRVHPPQCCYGGRATEDGLLRPLGPPKLLLSRRKSESLARPFCSWNDGALTRRRTGWPAALPPPIWGYCLRAQISVTKRTIVNMSYIGNQLCSVHLGPILSFDGAQSMQGQFMKRKGRGGDGLVPGSWRVVGRGAGDEPSPPLS
jgi:hypothetical protein